MLRYDNSLCDLSSHHPPRNSRIGGIKNVPSELFLAAVLTQTAEDRPDGFQTHRSERGTASLEAKLVSDALEDRRPSGIPPPS